MLPCSFKTVSTAAVCAGLFTLAPDCLAGATTVEPSFKANLDTGASAHRKGARHSKKRHAPAPTTLNRTANLSSAPVATEDDPYGDEQAHKTNDVFEKGNRKIFAFNHQFYRFVSRPIAKATTFILREHLLTALGHVFENAEAPVRITASLLQGKFQRAGQETEKLVVNSTIGVGGLWKPSDRINGLKDVPTEDMGQTFGTWGIPSGPYLVVPVLGPSSVRDLPGKVADLCLNPTTWLGSGDFKTWSAVSQNVVENPDRLDAYDGATADALDPYIAMREAFTSYRESAVKK